MKRKDQILNAAKLSFIENGFRGAGIREIASTVGMSAANTYRYFNSKDQIVEEIVSEYINGLEEAVKYFLKGKDLKKELKSFYLFYISEAIKKQSMALSTEIYSEACRNKNILNILTLAEKRSLQVMLSFFENANLNLKLETIDTIRTIQSLADSYALRVFIESDFSKKKAINLHKQLIDLLIEV